MTETSRFIRPILEFLFPAAPVQTLDAYHGYIRKLAHVAEYAVLAFFAFRAFSNSSIRFLSNYRFPAAFCIVLLIASIDELNQSFVPSRTGSQWDVLLDISGGVFTVVLLSLTRNAKS